MHSDDFIANAVARARQVGTRTAGRELGVDARELKQWRRAENRTRHAEVDDELDALERRIETVTDLGELQRIQRELARIARELHADPERYPLVVLADA